MCMLKYLFTNLNKCRLKKKEWVKCGKYRNAWVFEGSMWESEISSKLVGAMPNAFL